ncbi:hypothetical protein N7461_002571 [Penicillium sp. DV-2018c]|nr:hypothetical protein N7461_002571 [Penicillium sp. DV-2018c]
MPPPPGPSTLQLDQRQPSGVRLGCRTISRASVRKAGSLLLDIDGKAGTGMLHPNPPLSAISARMASEAGRCRAMFPRSGKHSLESSRARFLEPPGTDSARLQAKAFYETFDQILELDTVMRQRGSNDSSVWFRGMLDRLCEESISRADFELLASRVQGIDPAGAVAFADALRILPTRIPVEHYNRPRLRGL